MRVFGLLAGPPLLHVAMAESLGGVLLVLGCRAMVSIGYLLSAGAVGLQEDLSWPLLGSIYVLPVTLVR